MSTQHGDPQAGVGTTGHEWDGIEELNNPLPKWWLYILYASIVWAALYWIAMPAWPLVSSYTSGLLGYSQRETVLAERDADLAARSAQAQALLTTRLEDIPANPALLEFAMANGKAAFAANCVPCHGAGGGGAKGYPNLQDDEWLHGGSAEQVLKTISEGVRSTSPDTLGAVAMPAFGRDGRLTYDEIRDVAAYVRTLSGLAPHEGADLKAGGALFAAHCASCHGPAGQGDQQVGAPRLSDAIWLFGGDEKTIAETVAHGRAGVMPTWRGKLDDATLRSLVVYVRSLGGGQ